MAVFRVPQSKGRNRDHREVGMCEHNDGFPLGTLAIKSHSIVERQGEHGPYWEVECVYEWRPEAQDGMATKSEAGDKANAEPG